MSKKEKIIAAIDIGTTKIVSIIGRKNEHKKLEILSLSKAPSKGVKRGVVQNIEETVNAIKSTIEEVQSKSGIIFSEVFVGIAGQHIKSIRNRGYINRNSDEGEITKKDIRQLIEDMHNIPIEVGEEYILENFCDSSLKGETKNREKVIIDGIWLSRINMTG